MSKLELSDTDAALLRKILRREQSVRPLVTAQPSDSGDKARIAQMARVFGVPGFEKELEAEGLDLRQSWDRLFLISLQVDSETKQTRIRRRSGDQPWSRNRR